MFTLPAPLMLINASGSRNLATDPGNADPLIHGAAQLAPQLLRERREPSSELVRLWIETLPSACPANLAVASAADLSLATLSLHAWKVEFLRNARRLLSDMEPRASEAEQQWATCMVLSRALTQEGLGPTLMPFTDLLNHGDSCTESSAPGSHRLLAARALTAGDEAPPPPSLPVKSALTQTRMRTSCTRIRGGGAVCRPLRTS